VSFMKNLVINKYYKKVALKEYEKAQFKLLNHLIFAFSRLMCSYDLSANNNSQISYIISDSVVFK
jgi:hypothetical protein